MSTVIAYTDGSSRGNPGPGGYGATLRFGEHYRELSQGYRKTTNNRMELLAIIEVLEAMKKPMPILIHSDSKYVIDAITKGWVHGWVKKGFKGKKNEDLWRRYLEASKRFTDLRFQWVKGHAGNPDNERVDELAVQAALGGNLLVDEGFESGDYN